MATLGDMVEALVEVEVGEDLAGAAAIFVGLDSTLSEKAFLRRFPGKHMWRRVVSNDRARNAWPYIAAGHLGGPTVAVYEPAADRCLSTSLSALTKSRHVRI